MTSSRDARSRAAQATPSGPADRPDARGSQDPSASWSAAGPSSGRRISPGLVILVIALIGSIAYVAFAITVRDSSQIPLLASGAVVLGIVFGALAVYCARATWRAGVDARNGRAILLGIMGGIAAIIAAGCFAGAAILFLL